MDDAMSIHSKNINAFSSGAKGEDDNIDFDEEFRNEFKDENQSQHSRPKSGMPLLNFSSSKRSESRAKSISEERSDGGHQDLVNELEELINL